MRPAVRLNVGWGAARGGIREVYFLDVVGRGNGNDHMTICTATSLGY